MQRIKILHIYKDFNTYNGLIEILLILAGGINHSLFELGVCVFNYKKNSFGEEFERRGGRLYSLGIPKRIGNELREVANLYSFLRNYQPHIVQTHVLKANLFGILAAKKAKVPIIIGTEMTLKDIAHSKLTRLRDRILHPFLGPLFQYCDAFMVTSEFIKKQWYRQSYAEKFKVIYPPFNLEKYLAAQERLIEMKSNSRKLKPTIVFVGRLSEEKGLEPLIQAMFLLKKEVPNINLIIAGTGPLESKLKQQVKKMDLSQNVVFTGFCNNSFELIGQSDVFVLPSRTEGAPIVLIEAMAMGVPIVATKVGGIPELVEDNKIGLLIKDDCPKKIASAIFELLKDPKKACQMGIEGKHRAFNNFHQDKFIGQMEEMYLGLLDKKRVSQQARE